MQCKRSFSIKFILPDFAIALYMKVLNIVYQWSLPQQKKTKTKKNYRTEEFKFPGP